jgi:hypothetical protein
VSAIRTSRADFSGERNRWDSEETRAEPSPLWALLWGTREAAQGQIRSLWRMVARWQDLTWTRRAGHWPVWPSMISAGGPDPLDPPLFWACPNVGSPATPTECVTKFILCMLYIH